MPMAFLLVIASLSWRQFLRARMKALPSITGVAEIVLNVRDLRKMRDFYRVLNHQARRYASRQAWSSATVSANRLSATCLCEGNFRWPRTNSVDTESPGLRNPSRELRGSQRTARSPQSRSSHGRVSSYERTGPLFPRPGAESFGAHLPR